MAIILIAVVLAVITGLNYFGKPISRTMWLVLFILSAVLSGPDTVGLFTFLTLERLSRASPNDLPIGSCSPGNEAEVRRLPHANAGSDLVPQFVTSPDVFLEFKAFVTPTAR
jgi:hypothetical protein